VVIPGNAQKGDGSVCHGVHGPLHKDCGNADSSMSGYLMIKQHIGTKTAVIGIFQAGTVRYILFTDYFHQDPFFSSAVKFSVKNPLPGAEIQFSLCDSDYAFPAHDLPLHVGIGIVFTHIVLVLGYRFMGGQFFQPLVIVMVQSGLIIVDKNRCGNMHGIHQDQSFRDPAVIDALLNIGRNIYKRPSGRYLKPQFFPIGSHDILRIKTLKHAHKIRFLPVTMQSYAFA
jgi:hypothetical protein